jgi:GTP cyclohydrolase I
MDESNEPKITLFSNTGYNDIIAVKKIPFYSVCAHHMLPIFGDVSIAYIPGEKIVGLSKIPRVVKFFSQRLQVQETFSEQIADYLLTKLNAKGVFVLVKARHLCLEMRGVTMPNLETVSSTARGIFETSQAKREEALQMMINGNP